MFFAIPKMATLDNLIDVTEWFVNGASLFSARVMTGLTES